MAIKFEKIVAEDLQLGDGSVNVTMPGGGTAVGTKINLATFEDEAVIDAFAAANFTSNGGPGSWVVGSADVNNLRLYKVGKMAFLTFNLSSTAAVAAGTELYIKIPGGVTALNAYFAGSVRPNGLGAGNNVNGYCMTMGGADADKIRVLRANDAAWGTVDPLGLHGEIWFEMA